MSAVTYTLTYDKKKLIVDAGAKTVSLMFGKTLILSQEISQLIFASATRPWEIDYAFEIGEILSSGAVVSAEFSCKKLSGKIEFSFDENGFVSSRGTRKKSTDIYVMSEAAFKLFAPKTNPHTVESSDSP